MVLTLMEPVALQEAGGCNALALIIIPGVIVVALGTKTLIVARKPRSLLAIRERTAVGRWTRPRGGSGTGLDARCPVAARPKPRVTLRADTITIVRLGNHLLLAVFDHAVLALLRARGAAGSGGRGALVALSGDVGVRIGHLWRHHVPTAAPAANTLTGLRAV